MDEYQAIMTKKLGLPKYNKQLISELLKNMAIDKVDYTNFFRSLSNIKADSTIPEDELLIPLKAVLLDIGKERKDAWTSWLKSYLQEVIRHIIFHFYFLIYIGVTELFRGTHFLVVNIRPSKIKQMATHIKTCTQKFARHASYAFRFIFQIQTILTSRSVHLFICFCGGHRYCYLLNIDKNAQLVGRIGTTCCLKYFFGY